MNSQQTPLRASLKLQARQAMIRWIRPCMAASGIMLVLQLAALYFEMTSGGVLSYFLLSSADYTTATGIWLAEGGLTAILRIDAAGVLFALPLSFHQIITFVIVHGIVFIVTVPLLMGTLEQYHAVLQERVRPFSDLFRWYLDLRLTAKAVGLGLALALVKWIARIAGALPGLALFVWVTGNADLGAASTSGLMSLATFLTLAGVLAAYFVYTLVLPAQYLLAREPDASVGHVLSAGVRAFQGRRMNYFLFRLSFFLWYLIVNTTYGIMGLFVQPYSELSNLLYLQSALGSTGTKDVTAQS